MTFWKMAGAIEGCRELPRVRSIPTSASIDWCVAAQHRQEKRLADFWRSVSSEGTLPLVQRQIADRLLAFLVLEGIPVQAWFEAISRYVSPSDLNPLNINPLRGVIERFGDFAAVRRFTPLPLPSVLHPPTAADGSTSRLATSL